MQFRILGPMEVVAGLRPVDTGSPKQRAVLAMLLIEANRVVSLDRLIDQLWGHEPPARATGSLQVYVANLRRALEPDRPARAPAQVLVTQPPGYLLRVDAADLDSACFEHLAAEGRRLLAEGHPAPAREALTEALGLWRGPALAEFSFETFAQAEIARLEELRWLALEDRVEADLALGHHGESVAELERLVADQPLRERLHGLLMLALYRSGRQAEALRAFQDARSRLADELGIDPGPSLQRLEGDILRQAPTLDWQPAPRATAGGTAPAATPPPAAPGTSDDRANRDDGTGRGRMVGRDDQLVVLERALADACQGRGRIVLLCGEAGIGKTTLADALGHRAAAAGALVVWGRCYEGEGAPPFWPWAQVLRDLVAHTPADELAAAAGAGAADLAQLVPELGARPEAAAAGVAAPIDPEAARFRLYDSTTRLLLRASAARPLVLVLDDLHWADVASLRLLQFLAVEVRTGSLLVVGTFRDGEVSPGHPLAEALGALAREPALERLQLGGLDRGAVEAYIEAAAGSRVDAGVVDEVHDRTEGNPFFIEELVRLLASEGRLTAPAGASANGTAPRRAVPAGVGDTIRRRVGRLPEDAQTVLTMASVVGREFDLDVLARACQLDADRVLDLVETAILTGIVIECPNLVGRLRFAHALTRETLYDGLSQLRRARLHARVAQALEAVEHAHPGTRLAELAHHFGRAAAAGFTDQAIAYAIRAADRAAAQLAYEEVARHCEQALAIVAQAGDDGADRDDLRFDLLLRLGRARKSGGDQEGGRAALQQAAILARASADPARLARVATSFSGGNWWGWWSGVGVVDHAAVALLEEALAALPHDDSPARALVLGRLAGELYFTDEIHRRRELADEAVAVARRLARDDALAKALRDRYIAVWEPGNPEERLAIAGELVAAAQRCGRRDLELLGRTFRLLAALQLGDGVTADAELDASEAIARELRAPVLLGHIGWGRSMKALVEGRFAEAEARIHDNLAATQRYNHDEAVRTWSGQLVQLYEQQGRMALLEPTVRSYIEVDPKHLVWRTALALLLAEDGRTDEAREHFEMVAASDFADTPRDVAWLFALAARAEVCTLLGDRRRAALLYDLLAPYDHQVIVLFTRPLCAGAVAHYVGSLALVMERYDEAEAHLRRAVELHEGLGARPFLARSQVRLAQVLHDRGDPADADEAGALLDKASATVAELGMAGVARRIHELRAIRA
ncbi:MAG TPA: BTAD domain-containing putative transcriptional regulator [Acidimicrobiales bacterium]|nr:BTAD domain-containing putative transcriptional regulator [Acidimicrobiales bacterium]